MNPQEEIKFERIVHEKGFLFLISLKGKKKKTKTTDTRMNDDIQPKIEGKAKKSRLAWKICGSSHSKLHSREPRLIQFCTLDSPQAPPTHNKTLQFRPTPG
jgi:hypothetical protein